MLTSSLHKDFQSSNFLMRLVKASVVHFFKFYKYFLLLAHNFVAPHLAFQFLSELFVHEVPFMVTIFPDFFMYQDGGFCTRQGFQQLDDC